MSQSMLEVSSPNYNDRKVPISILVLHYTGMESGEAALQRLCDPDAQVSAHYLLEEDGRLFQLVKESDRAWHAGVSEWNGVTDVNSASIGIEIVNGGHDYGLPDFADTQINALIPLCKQIIGRHDILPRNIVGHSDIAPGRKQDPGEKFPWQSLAAAGIGLWPGDPSGDQRPLFGKGDRDRGVTLVQRGLAGLGYGIELDGVMTDKTMSVIEAFQRRYRPQKIDGLIDMGTLDLVSRLAAQL